MTGRGNVDYMRMHLNYAKLGGGNEPKNWVVAPQWINKSPTVTAIESSALKFLEEDKTNMLWYEAKVIGFRDADEKWNGLKHFPKALSYKFGKYEIGEDGKTWEKKASPLAKSGSVSVPAPDVERHKTPRINMPSKTDYFTNNTKENKAKIRKAGIGEEQVDLMKKAREYTSYSELQTHLLNHYPDKEFEIEDIIVGLKKLEQANVLKW